jgi:hypothetical protein
VTFIPDCERWNASAQEYQKNKTQREAKIWMRLHDWKKLHGTIVHCRKHENVGTLFLWTYLIPILELPWGLLISLVIPCYFCLFRLWILWRRIGLILLRVASLSLVWYWFRLPWGLEVSRNSVLPLDQHWRLLRFYHFILLCKTILSISSNLSSKQSILYLNGKGKSGFCLWPN